MNLKEKLFYSSLLIVIGIFAGFALSNYLNSRGSKNSQISQVTASEFHAGGYKYINPLYECNTSLSFGPQSLRNIEKDISGYISRLKADGKITDASVYFRDLNNGPWFGVGEHAEFAPSSLLKTPVMMAYFKEAQDDPSILDKKIKYDRDPEGLLPQNFKPKNPLQKGHEYSVEELIKRMIEESDNIALILLEDNIDGSKIDKVTLDLGISTATDATPDNFMNVVEYATLFRVLYNATYLNPKYSERALMLLANSEFDKGLRASIPSSVTVSHKFGERALPDGIHQLHDCGIVYSSQNPFLICIMTKGNDFNDLLSTIKDIASKIYLGVSKKN